MVILLRYGRRPLDTSLVSKRMVAPAWTSRPPSPSGSTPCRSSGSDRGGEPRPRTPSEGAAGRRGPAAGPVPAPQAERLHREPPAPDAPAVAAPPAGLPGIVGGPP